MNDIEEKGVELNLVEARTEFNSIELAQIAQNGKNHFELTRRSLISNTVTAMKVGDAGELEDLRNLINEMLSIQLDA